MAARQVEDRQPATIGESNRDDHYGYPGVGDGMGRRCPSVVAVVGAFGGPGIASQPSPDASVSHLRPAPVRAARRCSGPSETRTNAPNRRDTHFKAQSGAQSGAVDTREPPGTPTYPTFLARPPTHMPFRVVVIPPASVSRCWLLSWAIPATSAANNFPTGTYGPTSSQKCLLLVTGVRPHSHTRIDGC